MSSKPKEGKALARSGQQPTHPNKHPKPNLTAGSAGGDRTCPGCGGPHAIWRCPDFKKSTYGEKTRIAKENNLCKLCLEPGHWSSQCQSGRTCQADIGNGNKCGKKHNTLFHLDERKIGPGPSAPAI